MEKPTLLERFEAILGEDADHRFEEIENPEHPMRDVCAMLLLHRLCGHTYKVIHGADHDVIFLDFVDEEKLNDVITDDQILYLCRCGVQYDDGEYAGLYMNV